MIRLLEQRAENFGAVAHIHENEIGRARNEWKAHLARTPSCK